MAKEFKIRYRERVCASPKAGRRQSWGEYQVIDGRKVIARFDLRHQAEKFIASFSSVTQHTKEPA